MSTNKLDETLRGLDLDSSATELKEQVISKSMNNLKEKVSGLDIRVEKTKNEVQVEEVKPHYEGTDLADAARDLYRNRIKPLQEKKVAVEVPDTIASRANMKAMARSLAGLRTSGNEGKVSPVGPNGTGNLGKESPTGENGSGNVGTNTRSGNYYALTTDMTLEEYEAYVQDIFEGDDCECKHDKMKKAKEKIKARGGPPGYEDTSKEEISEEMPKFNPLAGLADLTIRGLSNAARGLSRSGAARKAGAASSALRAGSAGSDSKRNTNEDVVYELEQRLITLGSTDWIQVDQVLREMSRELDVAPRTLSREFKSVHGVYPDKWIKENLEVEVCGYMPLEEAARLNKVGSVYEVSFMFRGGTNRLKFFWPMPGTPSKEDMQREVEKFWPKARLIAYYPTLDNVEQTNCMVMAPPMTENYHFLQPDVWTELSEDASEMLEMVYEEEGEPVSPIMNEDNGFSVYVEDHDTGEHRQIYITEEGLRDWFGKSKSKDGKKGWVNVVTGDSCASDKPGEGIPKCVSSDKRASMSDKERKAAAAAKRREDPGQQSKSGASKPTNVKTDRKVKEDVDCPICGEDPCGCIEGNLNEESDKKGKGSGKKDACYHKVKSRYSVWPSAYASGALVKCRQKGAANWGNSSKKEEVEYVDEGLTGARADRARQMQDSDTKKGGGKRTDADRDTAFRLGTGTGPGRVSDRDRKGASAQGKGNAAKRRMKEEVEQIDERVGGTGSLVRQGIKLGGKKGGRAVQAGTTAATAKGKEAVNKAKQGSEGAGKNEKLGAKIGGTLGAGAGFFVPDGPAMVAGEIAGGLAGSKIGGAIGKKFDKKPKPVGEENFFSDLHDELLEDSPAWQRKEGKNESGGLNQKGVDSYRRENPGSKLKTAVTKDPSKLKKGGKAAGRRKSFCSRMKGMKSKLTSAKTANDPDSRINKSLRKWNC